MHKRCPVCDRTLPRAAFYEERRDEITGLSHLCRECIDETRAARRARQDTSAWAGESHYSHLAVSVVSLRRNGTAAVRFAGSRTVVLPARRVA